MAAVFLPLGCSKQSHNAGGYYYLSYDYEKQLQLSHLAPVSVVLIQSVFSGIVELIGTVSSLDADPFSGVIIELGLVVSWLSSANHLL